MNHGTWDMEQWGIFVVLATLPAYLIRFNVGPIPTTVLEVMIYALAVVSFFRDREKLLPPTVRPILLPTALLVVAALIGVAVAPDTRAALGIFKAYFFDPLLFLWVFLRVIRTDSDRKFAMTGLAVGALFVATAVIVQWMTNVGIPPPWNIERRATGIFQYPNAVGLFLAPIATLLLASVAEAFRLPSIRWRPEGRRYIGYVVIALLSLVAMILSKTEAGLLAVAAGLALFGLLHSTTSRRLTVLITGLALVFVVSVPTIRQPLTQKITLQDWSGTVRRLTWSETITLLKDRPILGAGLSGYPAVFAPYHKHTAIEIFQYPHNIILNFWSELGLIGLVAFIWLVVAFFRSVFARSPTTKQSSIALAAAVTTLLIHGLFDVPYFKNDLAILFWVLIALAISGSVEKHGGVPKWS